MDHMTRTIIFAVVAVISVSMGSATYLWIQPRDADEYTDIGEAFFPDFTDPFKARAIEVSTFNQETSRTDTFRVEFQDGVWRIPSHYNYPADGQQQLAKTATSIIGLSRDTLESRDQSDHQQLGVIDPRDRSLSTNQGRGTRVTLYDEAGGVLVDYIIGNRPDPSVNRYFVRRADEERTYLSKLDLRLSTKFTDWIEPDLLQVSRNRITSLFVDDYSIVETPLPDGSIQIGIQQNEPLLLTRESGGFEWTLDGLDTETESLKMSVLNAMLTTLDDLQIVGVRPKPALLQAELRGEQAPSTARQRQQMVENLMSRGFYLGQGLLSDQGALLVGTDEGISYQILVGNVFIGSQQDVEIGTEFDPPAETSDESPTEEEAIERELAPGEQRSRYVFILAQFDQELLGDPPVPPVKPTPPEVSPVPEASTEPQTDPTDDSTVKPDETPDRESNPPDDDSSPPDATSEPSARADDEPPCQAEEVTTPDGAEATEEPATSDSQPSESAETADPGTPDTPADASATTSETEEATTETPQITEDEAMPAEPDPQALYEAAMQEYEILLAQYEQDLEEYQARVENGRKKARELADRFAPWYYVIPADVFEALNVSRSDLVQPKSETSRPSGPSFEGTPDFDFPGIPMLELTPSESTEPMPEMSDSADPAPQATATSPDNPETDSSTEAPPPDSPASESDTLPESEPTTPDEASTMAHDSTDDQSDGMSDSPLVDEAKPED